MENHDSDENAIHEDGHSTPIKPKKQTWWMKLGGGSLMIAALIHAVLFIAGGLWVYQVIYEAEKKVDFMPAGGGGGGVLGGLLGGGGMCGGGGGVMCGGGSDGGGITTG